MQNVNNEYLNTNIYCNYKRKRALGSPVCSAETGNGLDTVPVLKHLSHCQGQWWLARLCLRMAVFLDGELEHSVPLCQCP